jgi:hypothetical protein
MKPEEAVWPDLFLQQLSFFLKTLIILGSTIPNN